MRRLFCFISILFCFAETAGSQSVTPIADEKSSGPRANAEYTPEVFGAVKAKFETSLYDGQHRFNVRNSRIGVRGSVSPHMKYTAQIDFSNEGKVTVLDAYAEFLVGGLSLSLGQQQYHFSTDLDRGPNSSIFANRSFLAKFLTNYYGSTMNGDAIIPSVGSIGSRDLGLSAEYKFDDIPLKLIAGIFNGTGVNNPEWSNSINLVGKVSVGKDTGFGVAASHYNGEIPVDYAVATQSGTIVYGQRVRMWGGELRYAGRKFRVEGEYAQRRLKNDELHILHAAHVLGYYRFDLERSSIFSYLAPVGRWDMGRDIEFMNMDGRMERFSSHRVTVGVNMGLNTVLVGSELRLQFEKYLPDGKPSDYRVNPLLQDKVSVEFVASF